MYNLPVQPSNPYEGGYGSYGAYGSAAASGGAPAAGSYYNPNQGYTAQASYYGGAAQQGAAPQQQASSASPSSYNYGSYGYVSAAAPSATAAPTSGYPYGGSGGRATTSAQASPVSAPPIHASASPPSTSAPSATGCSPYGYQAVAAAPAPSQPPAPSAPSSVYPSSGNVSSTAVTASDPYPVPSSARPEPLTRQPIQQCGDAMLGSGSRDVSRPLRPLARQPPARVVNVRAVPNPERSIQRSSGAPVEYLTCTNEPPYATVNFVGLDNGNANSKFFRPSMLCAPGEERLVKDSHVPFGAILAPLCQPLHNKEVVPLVKQPKPPVRCHRCRGYMSCHAQVLEMGRKWECPLCEVTNDVADDLPITDGMGGRVSVADHPELSFGSVEFDVDDFPEYALRTETGVVLPNRPLHHLFLIDISRDAGQRFLADYAEAIRAALQRMAELTPECRVSFITFASQLHFYNFRHPDIPQLCVPDIENPFAPLPFTSLCWLEVGTELERLENFLTRLPRLAVDADESDCVLGAAVKAATLVLAGQHGGRVIMCAGRHPQRGIGHIVLREQHKLYGTDREKELLRPIEGFWTTTAAVAARQQISFDLFMFATGYCELVTLSNVCHVTNGRVLLFNNYDPLVDNTKVSASMQQLLTEEAGYAGILRVRCSTGLHVQRYRGHYLSQTVQDMDLASITGSSTFFVEFAHEDNLPKDNYAHYQTALLYTTRSGHRRVRVQSCRLRVASSLTVLFRNMDLEAVLFGFIQDTMAEAVNKGPRQARQGMTDRLIKAFLCYRQYCASEKAGGDYEDVKTTIRDKKNTLLMPPRLKLLPVYLLCLMKSDALTEGTIVHIDHRVASIFDLVAMPAHKLLNYLYPSLFCLDDLESDPAIGTLDVATGDCILPHHRQLLFDSVARDGTYLLCDEQARLVYMWIGENVPPKVASTLFGTPDVGSVCVVGGPGEECFSERLRNVLYALMLRDDGMRRLIVIHHGERSEDSFFKELKEEMCTNKMGYDEYLTHLHRTIQTRVSSGW
ncbi:protein transport protein Sec24C, putative [Leishmania guyanensis]|uniref:Protein transport protein Sec24C, putative n=2 Tax=Leishmania guyanensis species complex TaxID=38579 RepID=A0A1E1IXZ7_LEIGU|nr:protein transport protein Sec24C, putative [Leishmania guyanensis]